jgi:hypothetical protein
MRNAHYLVLALKIFSYIAIILIMDCWHTVIAHSSAGTVVMTGLRLARSSWNVPHVPTRLVFIQRSSVTGGIAGCTDACIFAGLTTAH